MDIEKYGEVINGENTYKTIAKNLKNGKSVIVGWTDEEGTHFDILFSLNVLFVSIMKIGAFGFLIDSEKHSGYIGEKLNLGDNITTEKLTELINGIIGYLKF